jgi:hypothetical protein
MDERLGSGQEGTVAGKPGRRAGPQPIGSETGDLAKSVETAAMRVAGQGVEFFEFSENGEVDVRTEGAFQIGRVAILSRSSSFRRESGEKARGLIML